MRNTCCQVSFFQTFREICSAACPLKLSYAQSMSFFNGSKLQHSWCFYSLLIVRCFRKSAKMHFSWEFYRTSLFSDSTFDSMPAVRAWPLELLTSLSIMAKDSCHYAFCQDVYCIRQRELFWNSGTQLPVTAHNVERRQFFENTSPTRTLKLLRLPYKIWYDDVLRQFDQTAFASSGFSRELLQTDAAINAANTIWCKIYIRRTDSDLRGTVLSKL